MQLILRELVNMKRIFSPMLSIGLIIVGVYTVVDRFIISISDWLAIPLLVLAIGLIILDGFKTIKKK